MQMISELNCFNISNAHYLKILLAIPMFGFFVFSSQQVSAKDPIELAQEMSVSIELSELTAEKKTKIIGLAEEIGLENVVNVERDISYHPFNITYLVYNAIEYLNDGTSLQKYVRIADRSLNFSKLDADKGKNVFVNEPYEAFNMYQFQRKCKTPDGFFNEYIITAEDLSCVEANRIMADYLEEKIIIPDDLRENYESYDLLRTTSLTKGNDNEYVISSKSGKDNVSSVIFITSENKIFIKKIHFKTF